MTPTFAYLKSLITLTYYYANFKKTLKFACECELTHMHKCASCEFMPKFAHICIETPVVYLSALKDFSFSPLMSVSKALREFVNPLNRRYSLIKSSKYWWAIFKFRKIVKNFPLTTCQNETYNRRISKENPWKHN